ncbi:hypothetical protein [uncultured Thiodictyon sp.]|uniref:tetratricopeptide repeat protein n=1 Tax=uncultured Thiodictyon sp. TaxID=1846217 RepID=UPI0025D9D178|nr:hypothetical protein [uncultured Thiodictyon sp.]
MSYIFTHDTPFLNNVFLGTDLTKSPEIANLLETRRLRKEAGESAQQYLAAAAQTAGELASIRETLGSGTGAGLERIEDRCGRGLADIGGRLRDGLASVESGLRQNADGLYAVRQSVEQAKFELVEGLNNGFSGVIKSVHFGNAQLGAQLASGFAGLEAQHARTHDLLRSGFAGNQRAICQGFAQTGAVLAEGFDRVSVTLANSFFEHQQAILRGMDQGFQGLAEHLTDLHGELRSGLNEGFSSVMGRIDQLGALTARGQAALMHELRRQGQEIKDAIRHQHRHVADDLYLVGCRYLIHNRIADARESLLEAKAKFGGHFQSLILLGFIAILEGDIDTAADWMHKAYCQAGHVGDRDRERAVALLHLGRCQVARGDFQGAAGLFHDAFAAFPIPSALVEEAAALVRCLPDNDPAELVKWGGYIRLLFDQVQPPDPGLWYLLALHVIHFNLSMAMTAVGMGLHADRKHFDPADPGSCHREAILAHLEALNSRTFGALCEAMERDGEFAFLFP